VRAPNYWDYIRVEELLALQGGLEGDEAALGNDEVLFIGVHQVFELWFKLMLRELQAARDLFGADRVAEQELSGAVKSLRRVGAILSIAASHFEVMETLSTREFLGFRDKLLGASGFQSAQFRQIEILLGLSDEERIPSGLEGSYRDALKDSGRDSPALQRVNVQLSERPTLRDAVNSWLYRTPIDGVSPGDEGAQAALVGFIEAFLSAHAREIDAAAERAMEIVVSEADRQTLRRRYAEEKAAVRSYLFPGPDEGGERRQRIRCAMLFIETYRELPLLAWPREVLEQLVELEELFTIFRQRHARMVERIIGRRTGTGGSAGVDYLDQTGLRYRVFRDLWAIRTMQIRRAAAPPLRNPGYYDFANS
jgi:tryptophan 2,3-dioxygenase